MRRLVLVSVIALGLVACASQQTSETKVDTASAQALDTAIAGSWRDAKNIARDSSRNPKQTLQFFGVKPNHTVVEITPGGGWYTEILAPYLKDNGKYVAGLFDHRTFSNERAQKFYEKANTDFRAKFSANAQLYGQPAFVEADSLAPAYGDDNSADVVLTFRNVHNWVSSNSQDKMFAAFYDVLKPGGVLGVVEHRAAPGKSLDEVKASGYMPEEYVIQLAVKAGFVLDARSEINANAKDTRDHEGGVWALPPTLRNADKNRDKYVAIGESDRMTLRFVKPKQ
jgi:predicted methyltransferase